MGSTYSNNSRKRDFGKRYRVRMHAEKLQQQFKYVVYNSILENKTRLIYTAQLWYFRNVTFPFSGRYLMIDE